VDGASGADAVVNGGAASVVALERPGTGPKDSHGRMEPEQVLLTAPS
jgi:hypothetical protein